MKSGYTPSVQELNALIACAQAGTTSGAGQVLNVTQSAVSRSIRSLEDKLGVLLFDRVRQRLRLTDAGRLLVRDAEDILQQLDLSARAVLAFSGTSQVLRIAVLPTLGEAWLVPKLAGFQRAHPEISLDIGAELGVVDFAKDPYDCAIQRMALRGSGTECLPLMPERLVAVAAPALLDAHTSIENMPLLQQSTRPQMWQRWFEGSDVELKTLMRGPRFDHFGMVISAAKQGMGAALVPDVLVERELSERSLCMIEERAETQSASYALIFPAEQREHPALAVFRNWMQDEVAALL